jgi:hypothetical protein
MVGLSIADFARDGARAAIDIQLAPAAARPGQLRIVNRNILAITARTSM